MVPKMETLWAYQQADMEAFRLQRQMHQSEKRLKLKQSRDFLLKQKDVIEKIGSDVMQMADRIEAIEQVIADLETQVKALQEQFKQEVPQNVDDARQFLHDVKKLEKEIAEFEKELKSIQKKATDRNKQEYNVRVNAARVKQEFTQLKAEYEPEHDAQMKKLEELTKIAEEKAKDVDAELLAKYQSIRKHATPPLAKLKDNQCGGCDMALPSASLREFDSKDYIECTNCGRMLVK